MGRRRRLPPGSSPGCPRIHVCFSRCTGGREKRQRSTPARARTWKPFLADAQRGIVSHNAVPARRHPGRRTAAETRQAGKDPGPLWWVPCTRGLYMGRKARTCCSRSSPFQTATRYRYPGSGVRVSLPEAARPKGSPATSCAAGGGCYAVGGL